MTDSSLRGQALRTLLAAFPGTTAPDWVRRLGDEGLGGIILFGGNIVDVDQVTRLVGTLRAGRPELIVSVDEEGGDVTRLGYSRGSRYPGNAALGTVDDLVLTREVYRALGGELAALGITLDLAPTVDVNSAPDNPVIGTRSFGTDPARVAAHTAAAVAGLADAGVAACAKHFPGHGATRSDSHDTVAVVDDPLPVLRVRDLPPFAAAIGAGAPAIMTAHIRLPALTADLPATFSPAILRGLLRDELGFTGAIVTDALEMGGAAGFAGVGGLGGAAVRSLTAGADLLCLGARITEELVEAAVAAIVAAVESGELPAERLADAAHRSSVLATGTRASGTPAGSTGGDGIGLAAARRALRVDGALPDGGHRPLVVELDAPPTIAVGEVPWGLRPFLESVGGESVGGESVGGESVGGESVGGESVGGEPATEVVRLNPLGGTPLDVPGLLRLAGDRPIVLVTRDTHRHRPVRDAIERITAASSRVVLVEMGWPAWRPGRAAAYLATFGAGPANARAAAEALNLVPTAVP